MLKRLLQIALFTVGAIGTIGWWRWWQIRRQRIPAPKALSLVQNPDKIIALQRNGSTLIVEWAKASTRTEIYLGDALQDLKRVQPAAIVDNKNFAILHGIDTTTRYQVEIVLDDGTIYHQLERILPLKSVANFRDIGGYKTKDGQLIRWNRVYRSSALDHLSVEDSKYLDDLGIKLVCDVRTLNEHLSNPDRLPNHIEVLNFPPSSDDSVWLVLGRLLFQEGFLESLLLDLYQRVMIDNNPQVFASIFQRLGDECNLPIVIHCAAGKDRTGISIALLLSFLGVPDETIIADYALSNRYYDFFKQATRKNLAQLRIMGLTESDFDYLLIADGAILQKTLDTIRQNYGSVEQYLISYVGVPVESLAAVRRNLLA